MPESLDSEHSAYGHLLLVYFDLTGRMQWRGKAQRCSGCAGASDHPEKVTAKAVLVACDQPDAPPGASAWMVHAGAPDADTAHKTALTVAKALGAQLNPVLPELGVET